MRIIIFTILFINTSYCMEQNTTQQLLLKTTTYANNLMNSIKIQAYCTPEELEYAQSAQYINDHEIAINFGNHTPKIISLAQKEKQKNVIWKKENVTKHAIRFETGTIMYNGTHLFEPERLTYPSLTQIQPVPPLMPNEKIIKLPNEYNVDLLFSPNGKYLASRSLDNTIRIFNIEQPIPIQNKNHPHIKHEFTKKPIKKMFLSNEYLFVFSSSYIFIYTFNGELKCVKKIQIQPRKIAKTKKQKITKLICQIFDKTKYTNPPKQDRFPRFILKAKQTPTLYELVNLGQQEPVIKDTTNYLYNSLRNILLFCGFIKCLDHLGKMKMDPHAFFSLTYITLSLIKDGISTYLDKK